MFSSFAPSKPATYSSMVSFFFIIESSDSSVYLGTGELFSANCTVGQAAASSRTVGSGLRVVHRRFRHARFEGGEGVVGGVGVMRRRERLLSQFRIANGVYHNCRRRC